MPITCKTQIARMSQAEFTKLDYELMALAFKIHSEYGRFCHESVYQGAFVQACEDMGLSIKSELQVSVSHLSFSKHYYVDVLVGEGVLYELKTVERLVPEHRTQTLTYLILLGLCHGKLINWRAPSLQSEFVSTSLSDTTRREFSVNTMRWDSTRRAAAEVHKTVVDLLNDWGAFLSVDLYRDAIMQLVTGTPASPRRVEIRNGARVIGRQPFYLIAPGTALAISASTTPRSFEKHLQRLLNHTKLENMFWVNMSRHDIVCVTLNNEDV